MALLYGVVPILSAPCLRYNNMTYKKTNPDFLILSPGCLNGDKAIIKI